jgi:hypothetical protein
MREREKKRREVRKGYEREKKEEVADVGKYNGNF